MSSCVQVDGMHRGGMWSENNPANTAFYCFSSTRQKVLCQTILADILTAGSQAICEQLFMSLGLNDINTAGRGKLNETNI